MSRQLRQVWLCLTVVTLHGNWVSLSAAAGFPTGGIQWLEDYREAMEEAKNEGKKLFIWFHDGQSSRTTRQFELAYNADDSIRKALRKNVLLRLEVSDSILSQGENIRLLDHGAFAELKHRPGVAIIDLIDRASRHYGHVISIYPFSESRFLNRSRLFVLLNLPSGSLTQRTLIFAVRTHAEQPASASERLDPVLAEACQQHSAYQASMTLQGHHHWSTRASRIQSRLTNASIVQEVCAESWPGQDIVDAAIECVRSWRHSPKHWGAVGAPQSRFGFDMKRGRNGVWYATGIFVR